MITAAQIRAARALLRLEQTEVARRANVSLATLRRAESTINGRGPSLRSVKSIQDALEAAGIEFIDNGVKLRSRRSPEEIAKRVRKIMDIAHQSAKFAAENPGGFTEEELYDENGLPA